jgi:Fe-S cluster assembly ATP-binding protein|uniref:ATP-binding subunit of ABC transporter n=2 Tax=Heterosigma akashiwo TaxID=2829 RepID=B2XT97_HETAK|nr:sulfate ABC transporter protein [Heterosigma akashiwo]ABV65995.1 ATP-binding subunit of ABC transporter [Heterosigma akashiwo]ABV70136.1 ATP-binding subunit of ABC transporter [Heterosigma akashiwo]BBA18203.1 ATP-binding subunit of ABC transporter [Heterosigma akashiwo]BBA18342.1 ATP-binding subunit of ABC transporter [Heterosigma akashiwo]BBA18481.1 ATP-binding subunit of ABC transporter [Heterosigma akashiwo]|mmetsp:Transcript_32157/g.47034  ORF Transcript_32157/g.47034 Transcript_32157/m.47034 type:complete len:287 (-) Transcript_32157:1290-2150(-)
MKKYIEEKYVFSKDVDSNLHGEDVFFRFEDEDIKKEKKLLLEIKNLHATVNDNEILKGINLKINEGETHAIMGPNGSGKSTLAKVLVGHPGYQITKGSVFFKGKNLLELEPEQISHLGLFLAFQYPFEVNGVTNAQFLRTAYNSKLKSLGLPEDKDPLAFYKVISDKLSIVGMNPKFLERNVNEGFSGGEKKRNEILQLALLDSQLAILDETDSGLDIDALQEVSTGFNKIMRLDKAAIIITHYQRLLNYIPPDFVHVIRDGQIVKTGGLELSHELEKRGYDCIES